MLCESFCLASPFHSVQLEFWHILPRACDELSDELGLGITCLHQLDACLEC